MNTQTSAIDKYELETDDGFGESCIYTHTLSWLVALLFVLVLETLCMQVLLSASLLHSILFSLVAMAALAITLLAVDWLMTDLGREIKIRYTRFSHQLDQQSRESPVGHPSRETTERCVNMKSRDPQAATRFDA